MYKVASKKRQAAAFDTKLIAETQTPEQRDDEFRQRMEQRLKVARDQRQRIAASARLSARLEPIDNADLAGQCH